MNRIRFDCCACMNVHIRVKMHILCECWRVCMDVYIFVCLSVWPNLNKKWLKFISVSWNKTIAVTWCHCGSFEALSNHIRLSQRLAKLSKVFNVSLLTEVEIFFKFRSCLIRCPSLILRGGCWHTFKCFSILYV